jgi:hypothetical protein
MKMKTKLLLFAASVALLGVSGTAAADSILDSTMSTALSSGFTDLQDTVVDLVAQCFPYVIGVSIMLASPSLVKRFIRLIAGR